MERIVLCILALLAISADAGRSQWKRIAKLEDTVHQLRREVKDLTAGKAPDASHLAKETLSALEMESRALSQFDAQMTSLQSSLDQLGRHKDHQAEVIESFRRELRVLKADVDAMKEKSDGVARTARDTPSENAVKTLQWLLKSVSHLKTDVSQINQNLNVSKALQRAEDVHKQIHLVQGEVYQLRHLWTEESAERQKLAAVVVQMRSDLQETTANHQRCLKEIQSFKVDWNVTAQSEESPSDSHRSDRHWNHKFNELKSALQSVREEQHQLKKKIDRGVVSVPEWDGDIVKRFFVVESKVEVNEVVLAKLEASHNSIHEQMELINNQDDSQARETQLAIDQLQFNFTQSQVHWERALQFQSVTEERLSRVAEDVGLMEGEMERDRIAILALRNRAMNVTLQKCKDETDEKIRDVRLQTIQYQLESLKAEMDGFNKTMSVWNNAFQAASSTKQSFSDDLKEECVINC